MAGLPATIFVPQRAPEPKVAQLLIYGADVRRVRGTYAQAYDLCTAECDKHGWYNRNCAINPYLVEGKKTCGLEIAEQTAGREPDWVVVSVGDGCTIAGIAKGLIQMHELGIITRVPRILGVQAAGMDPIARAFETGVLSQSEPQSSEPRPSEPRLSEPRPSGSGERPHAQGTSDENPPLPHGRGSDVTPHEAAEPAGGGTLADSIDVPVPRNWRKAIKYVKATEGAFVRVTDKEITDAMKAAGRLAGVFAEPAAAAAVAGVKRAVADGLIAKHEDALAVVTGNGLKDIKTAMEIAGEPTDVEPLGNVSSETQPLTATDGEHGETD